MNKKKLFSIFLTCSIICCSIIPASALESTIPINKTIYSNEKTSLNEENNVKITKEDAIKTSKNILEKNFGLLVNEKDFKVNTTLDTLSYQESNTEQRVWNIQWYSRTFNSNVDIYVSIDASTGKLIYMNKNEYGSNSQSSIPTISLEEAQKIAEDMAKKINPKEFKSCKLSSDKWFANSGNSSNYQFNYIRSINSASYSNNNIYINVDGTTGKVTSYNCNWNYDLSIPSNENYISSQNAQNIFNNNTYMVLKYKLFKNKYEYQNKENKKNIKLVYEPKLKNGLVVDAKTGKFINNDYYNNIETAKLNEKETEDFYNKYKKLDNLKSPLKESEALDIIKNIVNDAYGKGYSINNLRYIEDDNKIWSAHFTKKINDKINQEGSISINALNGQVIHINNYYPYDYNEKFTAKFTWKEGYYKAVNLIGEYYKDKVKDINLSLVHEEARYNPKDQEPEIFYRYTFSRKVNNIPYEDNNIYIEFNAKTGEVSSMHCYWDDTISFVNPNKNIGIDKAKEAYFGKYKPYLNYMVRNLSENANEYKPGLNLVYSLDENNIFVDAFNSTILNRYDGEEVKFNISAFLDEIKGSKAEKEIKILAYKGLIDTDGFKLNSEVKNLDLIKTLVDALGYTPYIVNDTAGLESKTESSSNTNKVALTDEDYIKMAKYYGILIDNLENFKVDAKVSREDMCKSLIRFLGYDKIAQCSDIFVLNFKDAKDVSKENTGYIALAKGLNLISLDKNNNLNPKKIITNEELALGLYRTLQLKQVNYIGHYPMK